MLGGYYKWPKSKIQNSRVTVAPCIYQICFSVFCRKMSKSIRFLWLIFKDPQLCKLCNYYFNTKQISANIQTPHLKFRQGWWNICKKILLQTKSCSEFQSGSCWISNGAAVEHNIAMRKKTAKVALPQSDPISPKYLQVFKAQKHTRI